MVPFGCHQYDLLMMVWSWSTVSVLAGSGTIGTVRRQFVADASLEAEAHEMIYSWLSRHGLSVGLAFLFVLAGGCFSESTEELSFDEEDLLPEGVAIDAVSGVSPAGGAGSVAAGTGTAPGVVTVAGQKPTTRSLVKRVTQTLSQSSPDGLETSQAQLEAEFDVEVTALAEGDRSYRVVYRRLLYWSKLPGENMRYDSQSTGEPPPDGLRHLADLAAHGFSFQTIDRGTAIKLLKYPRSTHAGSDSGPEALDYVQDRIGMLLVSTRTGVVPRAPAPRTRKVVVPIPMELSTRYSIKSSTPEAITLDILGSVRGSERESVVALAGGTARVQLGGGHAFGELVVDPLTGLARSGNWNRYLEISLQTAEGVRIEQRKHEVVTLRASTAAPPSGAELQSVPPPSLSPIKPGG